MGYKFFCYSSQLLEWHHFSVNSHGVELEGDPEQPHQVECGVVFGIAESVNIQGVLVLIVG